MQDIGEIGVYTFTLKDEEIVLMPISDPYENKTQLLTTEESVSK